VAAELGKHAMFILKAPISGLLGATLFVAGARQEQLIVCSLLFYLLNIFYFCSSWLVLARSS
jgi:hypothetical protein